MACDMGSGEHGRYPQDRDDGPDPKAPNRCVKRPTEPQFLAERRNQRPEKYPEGREARYALQGQPPVRPEFDARAVHDDIAAQDQK
jgi:hypothetical protein